MRISLVVAVCLLLSMNLALAVERSLTTSPDRPAARQNSSLGRTILSSVPGTLSYQGQFTDADGTPLSGNYPFAFRIFDAATGGSELWAETLPLDVVQGVVDAVLGSTDSLSAAIFQAPTRWLEVEVGGDTLTPRTPFSTVPYAFRAERADTADVALSAPSGNELWSTNGTDVWRLTGNVGIGTSDPGGIAWYADPALAVGGSRPALALKTDNPGGLATLQFQGPSPNSMFHWNFLDQPVPKLIMHSYAPQEDFFTLTGDGKVGIGTTTPNHRLEAHSAAPGQVAFFHSTATSGTNYGIDAGAQGAGANTNIGGYFYASGATNNYAIIVPPGYGSVGIGTTNPVATLDVNGEIRSSDGGFRFPDGTLQTTAAAGSGGIGGSGTAGYLPRFTAPTTLVNSGVYENVANGTVGIGTSSPDAPMHLVSATVSNKGVLHVNATSATGTTRAIFAETSSKDSNSVAVFGQQNNPEPGPSGGTFGVFGRILRSAGAAGNSSAAVFGDAIGGGDGPDPGNLPDPFNALANGVQGETWSTNNSAAGGRFYAAQTSGQADAVYGQTNSTGAGSYALYGSGPMMVTGTKSAGVYTQTQGPSEMYSVEATEVWFEDIGAGKLSSGYARIQIDPLFREVVAVSEEEPYHVFLQFYDDVAMESCVVKRGEEEFEIFEKGGGDSNASFSYRIVAKRRHYESVRMRPVPVAVDRFMRPDVVTEGTGVR